MERQQEQQQQQQPGLSYLKLMQCGEESSPRSSHRVKVPPGRPRKFAAAAAAAFKS